LDITGVLIKLPPYGEKSPVPASSTITKMILGRLAKVARGSKRSIRR
jgi:hypothetical protein